MTDYTPIDCDRHSVLELLAMRRARVTLNGTEADAAKVRVEGLVIDVVTRAGAEYLVLQSNDGVHSVRLDRILTLHDGSGAEIWCQESGDRD